MLLVLWRTPVFTATGASALPFVASGRAGLALRPDISFTPDLRRRPAPRRATGWSHLLVHASGRGTLVPIAAPTITVASPTWAPRPQTPTVAAPALAPREAIPIPQRVARPLRPIPRPAWAIRRGTGRTALGGTVEGRGALGAAPVARLPWDDEADLEDVLLLVAAL